ncbi:MAG TPA: hypothetical protein VF756_18490 [Thermoanaerobaculia bacterium]
MAEDHVSRELFQRFFRSELSRRDTQQVVRHLLRECGTCLETAIQVDAEEGFVYSRGDFRSALFPDDPERYNETFQRALGSVDETAAELARERLRGIGLWHILEKHNPDRQLALVRADPRMHNWGLYDRLLEKCRETGFRAPAYAVRIAELALAVVETLDPAKHGKERIADFRAAALAALGNARRLASDFAGAESALDAAKEELSRGTVDPLEKAGLLSLRASLHKDLGEFERAEDILDRATAIYRSLKDAHLEGRTLLQQADTIGYTNPERAIKLAQDGLALIDPLREPRLEWCGRHTLALFLNDAGKPREALAMLETSRPLYAQFRDPWTPHAPPLAGREDRPRSRRPRRSRRDLQAPLVRPPGPCLRPRADPAVDRPHGSLRVARQARRSPGARRRIRPAPQRLGPARRRAGHLAPDGARRPRTPGGGGDVPQYGGVHQPRVAQAFGGKGVIRGNPATQPEDQATEKRTHTG